MLRDSRNLPVTVSGSATIDGINSFVEGLLGYETKAGDIVAAADHDSESTLANAYAAMFYMFLESPDAPGLAMPYIARADAAAGHATERERMVLEASRAWVENDVPRALSVSEELAARYPREIAAAKVAQYHYFNLGDAAGMLRIAGKVVPANEDLAYAHGMAAFAYEQAHMIEDAEASARRAMALKRKEPWAHHALSHVFLTQGRTQEARAFLDDVKETWTDLNSFMLTHNWWHLALVQIDQGETDAVLDTYDRAIWGVWKEYSQDQVNAVSLLARLELVGLDVGDRWNDLGAFLAQRTGDVVQPFLTMHYVYGLARARRPEVERLVEKVRDHAVTAPEYVRRAWAEVALPACEGLAAHAKGDWETAVRRLEPILSRFAEIGGSHAQRDLFEQIWLDSLIRTNRLQQAQHVLERRRQASPEAAPSYGQLAVVYDRLDLPAEAGRVMARARSAALRH